ncbi:uncharacterized protein LOC135709115 [Ochlerotatus camptorhynchus]|uniref:uncharacterized protein LOC135709115 n=1 Tax=Ochlerotatus camptorhynchus TaxID=644619 RepID=UPI0031E00A33
MDLECSSVVSIANGERNESVVVKSTRLTSSSNIYVNQISSIKFQAATVVSTSRRKPRTTTTTTTDKNHQRQGHPSVRAPTSSSSSSHRKNNHRHGFSPTTATSSPSTDAESNRNELMLIDPSELSDLSTPWQEGSSEEFFERDQGDGAEKLLWGGEKRFVREATFSQSEEEEDLGEGRLICPELGPHREQVKAESIRSYFGGGSRTRLRHCPREEGLLCLEAPVEVAVAYKYEIQLTYSLDRVAPIEPPESRTTHHRNRIKITNIISSFHGPMVNESSSVGSSTRKRTPIATTQMGNIMLLELALVNLGHQQQQQQQQQHRRSELVRVNIDTDCLSYLSSIAAEKSIAAQKSMDVRLWPDRLRTVRFQFRINATAVAGHNLEFPCTATVALVRSQPFKNPTRSRRYSSSNDDQDDDDDNHEQQEQQQQKPNSRIVVVAERKFLIKPGARCVCSDFACRCTCLLGMVSPMTAESQSTPGAVATSAVTDGSCQMVITFGGAVGTATTGDHHHHHRRSGFWHWICVLLMLVVVVLVFLGCIKAVLGCCCAKIGRWRYDFLQPTVRYKDASSYRRFLINLIFFLVYPCVLCCRCFERPGEADGRRGGDCADEERDHLLQQQGLLQGAMVVQRQMQPSTTTVTSSTDEDEPDEDILGDGWDSGGARAWSSNNNGTTDDELSKLLTMQGMQQSSDGGEGSGRSAYYNNTEDEDNDTKFVLDVMNRSRKSLQTLSAASESEPQRPESGQQGQKEEHQLAADQLVRELLQAKIVYRRLDHACGQVLMEPDQPYSIQGYFIAIDRGRYQFFTHALLRQFWVARRTDEEEERTVSKSSIPVRSLISNSFTMTYLSKVDVFRQNDLSVRPDKEAPCVNVEYL